jgi:type III secretory pathway component EscR
LIDFKTSNALRTDYCLQVAAYQQAIVEEMGTPIKSRIILRLGKEDGAFQPWFLPENTFAEDLSGFLTCLRLVRIMDNIEERMKSQRTSIKAIQKAQKDAAKALAKEQAALAKALEKVEAKRLREEEKQRIKAQAKEAREQAKQAKINLPMEEK